VRFVANRGNDRVADVLTGGLEAGSHLDMVTPRFSLLAFAELADRLKELAAARLILPSGDNDLGLLGDEADRAFRNRLENHRLARQCARWLEDTAHVGWSAGPVPQGSVVVRNAEGHPERALLGSLAFTTAGLGITPGNPMDLVQATENTEEAARLAMWFEDQWKLVASQAEDESSNRLLEALRAIYRDHSPAALYALVLYHLFGDRDEALDEEQIVKAATGIHETVVWQKLYRFQRDAVVGAIDKLNRHGGCIIADSVGLGKTFEALAVIKYHELRNDRVLVLTPKRLRDNWTLYRANDIRNPLASDRFNYDVLNHTDLSRDTGHSGDIDLEHLNWGNYDLVVIDESHNFRNKITHRDRESRYERLLRRIIRSGVRTRVLMLSATPVNNRLADLKNQIAFITEGDDAALEDHGIRSIDATTRNAQKQFNLWLKLPESERSPARLLEMLGFDYFKLLDLLTIARSRRHIEKYYGIEETGRFPERLRPINVKTDVDLSGRFPPIAEINREIRRLHLAAYAPLRYVLESRKAAYDEKYSTRVRDGRSIFHQLDREESLIHLMRVNLLKRMESSVNAFALTVERQLADVSQLLGRIEQHQEAVEELDISDIDIDDPTFETLLVGRKVKVLLQDLDLVRWRQDLLEDRNRLRTLLSAASQIGPAQDAKLQALKENIEQKIAHPINAGNRKVLVFTAFADTARYLYQQLAPWVRERFGLHAALVTGAGNNETTLPGLRKNFTSILSAFAPRARERPASCEDEGEIDLLIATDCISEGQNLQDCDWVVNFDIHWNPVRIIQRFGRIDRIGSPNERIQLVNFWPNMELDEYIDLEARVSGRMVLLDISATGEENLIQASAGDPMNDLEYRRRQLLKLQETVIDLEDLSSGISITDLTLTAFRMDLARHLRAHPGELESEPPGVFAVTTTPGPDIPPGIVFCLRVTGEAADRVFEPGYPLAPNALVHVGEDGVVHLPYTQAKKCLDLLKRACLGRDLPDAEAIARWNRRTRNSANMGAARSLLAEAAASIAGKSRERAVASLFTPGGTHAIRGEFAGQDDVEVLAWLVLLPGETP